MDSKEFYEEIIKELDHIEKQQKTTVGQSTYYYRDGMKQGLLRAEVIFTKWFKEQSKCTDESS